MCPDSAVLTNAHHFQRQMPTIWTAWRGHPPIWSRYLRDSGHLPNAHHFSGPSGPLNGPNSGVPAPPGAAPASGPPIWFRFLNDSGCLLNTHHFSTPQELP